MNNCTNFILGGDKILLTPKTLYSLYISLYILIYHIVKNVLGSNFLNFFLKQLTGFLDLWFLLSRLISFNDVSLVVGGDIFNCKCSHAMIRFFGSREILLSGMVVLLHTHDVTKYKLIKVACHVRVNKFHHNLHPYYW